MIYSQESKSKLQEMIDYIIKTFEPEGSLVVFQALEIAQCESHWRPNAYHYNTNTTGDYGLFQINSVHVFRYGTGFMYDWKKNVDTAYKIYKSSGWNPWVCWNLI
jgi:phosphomevalonate kinase